MDTTRKTVRGLAVTLSLAALGTGVAMLANPFLGLWLVIVGIGAAVVAARPEWVMNKYLFGKKEQPTSLPRSPEASWKQEMREFRDSASAVWNTLVPKFEKHGFFGAGASRGGLDDSVRAAPWPDEEIPANDAIVVYTEALRAFAEKLAEHSGGAAFQQTADFLAFDKERRQLSDVVRDWSARTDQAGFLDWLRPGFWPFHEKTLKLLWYLEIGVATAAQHDEADYRFIGILRDAFREKP